MKSSLSGRPSRACLVALAACALAAQVWASDALRSYDLPAGDAVDTVHQLIAQSGVRVRVDESLLRGVRTNQIRGEYSPRQALERLLSNTVLSVGVHVASGELVISRAAPLARVTVTGSRLRSLLGEQGANPVIMLTRRDIERSGVTTLAELRNLVPQLSVGSAAQFDGNSSRGTPDGKLLFDLRGLTASNTLVLVDGRRLPKTGQRNVTEAYEATGIPLSAVERVEVLLGGGSAIYGADAVGGVVNLITRKNYNGTEIEYARDDSFSKDAANDRLTLSHGYRSGGLALRAFVSHETQNALALRDRSWLASDDRRPFGGSDNTRYNLPVGGRVSAVSGNLPGIGRPSAFIPVHADGRNATIADFAAAPETPRYDAARHLNAINEYTRDALTLFGEYQIRPWAQVYADLSYHRNRSTAPSDPVSLGAANAVRLPANYPGNPFGVPILVEKYLWELGTPPRSYSFSQNTAVLGLRGELPLQWRYDVYASRARSNPTLPDGVFQFDSRKLEAALKSDKPPLLLHNSLNGQAPNAPGTLEALFLDDFRQDIPVTRSLNASADGPVWQLQAGAINLAVGAERRTESIRLVSAIPLPTEASEPQTDRVVSAQYAEVSVPLVSPKSDLRLPGLHSLTVSGAVRRDAYNDFGSATKPLLSLVYRPVEWIALRASRNEAFKVPTLVELTRARSTSNLSVPATGSSALVDPYRKNEPFVGPLRTINGGNPELKPENSVHRNFGLVFESPFEALKGLSISYDRWSSDILDRVGNLSRQERMSYFPESFSRAPLSAADAQAGYSAGRIIELDNTPVNIAQYRAAGYDIALRYQLRTEFGEWDLSSKHTRTNRVSSITRPGATPNPYLSPALRPDRTVHMISWHKQGLGGSLTVIHQDGFPVSLYPPVRDYPSTLQFNANFWYDFGSGGWHDREGWAARLLGNTRVSFGLINLSNKEPPLSSTGDVNHAIDPRLARYTLTLRRRF